MSGHFFFGLRRFCFPEGFSSSGAASSSSFGSSELSSDPCAASVLWSRIFLREKLSWRHYMMLVLIVAGIVLLGILDI